MNAGGYTAVSYVSGAGNGFTVTPNVGDTGKTLFFPNAGFRSSSGTVVGYGEYGYFWAAEENQSQTSSAWMLYFGSGSNATSGIIGYSDKLQSRPIRCVRS